MNRKEQFTMLSYKNRYEYTGIVQKVSFESMYKAFKKNFIRTNETVLEYKNGDKVFRDKCKDKGGFIMGESIENKREKRSIQKRNMITLDLDYCPSNIIEILKEKVEMKELPFRFFIYSTHSHTPEEPRLRMIIPVNRDMEVEEYEPIATRICGKVGLQYFDATTTQANRIMYFPSVSVDGEYICEMVGDDEWYDLDADTILGEFFDYKNIDEWQRPHYIEGKKRERIEKGTISNSTKTKYRIVNSFNIEYSITEAIDTFLQEEYKKENQDRYTYIKGESRNGLNILNPQYAYSFHATDPAQGRLLNAFDIVRIHKFGKQDQENEQAVYDNYNKSTSFQEMCKWIQRELPNVMAHDPKVQEQKEKVKENLEEIGIEVAVNWLDKLVLDKNGEIKRLPYNISVIIENDNTFKELFFYDTIKQQVCFEKAPYWDKDIKKGDGIRDLDFSYIRNYLAQPPYMLTGKDAVEDAVLVEAFKRKINYPKYFLSQLPEWDGVPRVETIIINLFGVGDCEFVREASKKWLTALVARIMNPGAKFDYVIALLGSVGIGKSTWGKSLIAIDWNGNMEDIEKSNYFFSDKEIDLRNERDTVDAIRGVCVLELAEFDKFLTKYDKATLKSFITKTKDRFIERYGKRTIDVPRSFVMLATSNESKPIKNPEDERRFMPFYCNLPKHKALIFDNKIWNKEIRDQVLAEALDYYNSGYSFSAPFPPLMQRQWETLIEKASLENDYFGLVKDYVENKFPINFLSMDFQDMRINWRDKGDNIGFREKRTIFSAKEIYCLALDKRIGETPDYGIRKEIEQSLKKLGFVRSDNQRKSFGEFGQQHYYELEVKEETIEDWLNKSEDERERQIQVLKEEKELGELSSEDEKLYNALIDSTLPF